MFDLELHYDYAWGLNYRYTDTLIRDFYNHALAHSEDSAFDLLRQLTNQASKAKEYKVSEILLPLMKELFPSVNTG
jgi:hypothetical protein